MYKIVNLAGVDDNFQKRDFSNYEVLYSTKQDVTDQQLQQADILIGAVGKEIIQKCKNLKLYQHSFAGSDTLKKEFFPEGCVVCNASGSYGTGISEYIICSLIMMMRNFPYYHNNQQNHQWQRMKAKGTICGSNILIVGFGDIGYEFGRKARYMGANIMGIRRHPEDCPDFVDEMGDLSKLDEMLPKADAVVLCLPNSAATTKIFTAKQFELMKEGSYLVNVGRGTVLDTNDLYKALDEGHLAGATIDVFDREPLDETSPVWDLDNINITPHAAGNLDLEVTKENFVDITMENLKHFETDQQYRNLVDFSTGYRTYQK